MLTTLERFANPDSPALHVDAERCLHTRDRFSTCDTCLDACPVGALHVEEHRLCFDSERCVACGLCQHLCPTGVFSGENSVGHLLNCAARVDPARHVELACAGHPDPARGPEADVVIRVDSCLAALGPAALAGLYVLGAEEITLRLDACAGCSIGAAAVHIRQTVTQAHRILAGWDHAPRLEILDTAPAPDGRARPVYQAAQPPVSRRDLFRRSGSERKALAEALTPPDEAPAPGEKLVPAERRQLLRALSLLPSPAPQALCPAPLAGEYFVQLAARESCTACEVCAKVCPTGALRFDADDDQSTFTLAFLSGLCTGCGACLDLCEPHALVPQGVPTCVDLLDPTWQVIRQGSFRRCAKCGAKLAGAAAEQSLCPACEFRRQNPFGHRLPGSLAGRDKPE